MDYLIPELRLRIGDINPASYRYTDDWLEVALLAAVKVLGRWWNFRYLVDESDVVSRNPNIVFPISSPPIIMHTDEMPIIIMAAIIVLEGSLENSAWDIATWRDAEISYSNLEGGRIRSDILKRLWDEMNSLMLPPTKKLARPLKGSLPGYKNNDYEREGQY